MTFILEYYDKYRALPDVDAIEATTKVLFKKKTLTRDQESYCIDEIEQFCKTKGLEAAIIEATKLYNTPEAQKIEQLIKNAISISINKDLGVNYFDNPLARLEKYAEEPQRIKTLWRDLDNMMGGGLARTELLLVSANSGGGKSIALANLSVNMFMQGLKVLYISLELTEKMIEERFNTMLTGISTTDWTKHIPKIASDVQAIGEDTGGHLNIKRMHSGTTANDLRSYINEYQLKMGITPDLLVVDYLDKMSPNERVSADNISQKDKLIAEQLVDVLLDYKMMGATASQQNRGAITDAELHQGHIAGGLTKINAVDWYFSIIFDGKMKAASTMIWQCLKARSSDATGKKVGFLWDNTELRIKNTITTLDFDDNGVIIDKIAQQKIKTIPKRTFRELADPA
jgi:KaiC/GvpD/RAD55 family RecA-like ATPase